jgi:hypothetical protein
VDARLQANTKTENQQAFAPRDVVATACYRSTRGAQIAARIDRAADASAVAALAAADRLRLCGSLDNVWHATDLMNEWGECYEGIGVKWACNERLCPSCMESRRRKARARAGEGMRRARALVDRRRPGERARFVTLTIPKLAASEVPLHKALLIVRDAWRTMTGKGRWWREQVRAGVKGVEFTLGDQRCEKHKAERKRKRSKESRECEDCRPWDAARDGYHVHIHALILSKWIKWDDLRAEWTAALKSAMRRHGVEAYTLTREGFAVCDVREVVKSGEKDKRGVSGDYAIREVTKYITKCESWLDIPEAQLVEIASIERWPRMFELLGDCRQERSDEEREKEKYRCQVRDVFNLWRETVAARREGIPADERIAALISGAEIKTERKLIELENGRLVTRDAEVLNDFQLYRDAAEEYQKTGTLAPATMDALKARTAYLDTQNLSAAKVLREEFLKLGRPRAGPLRDRPATLFAAFERGERSEWRQTWREELGAHAAAVGEFRRWQLSDRFPYATFSTLAGGKWFGRSVRAFRGAYMRET